MILEDFRVITGPTRSRDRRLFIGLTCVSAVVQAGALLMVVPFFRALFSDHPAFAWPWLLALVGVVAVVWLIDAVAMRAGLRLGLALLEEINRVGVDAVRHLDPGQLHGAKASQLRELLSTGGVEAVSAVVLLVSPILHACAFIPILSVLLIMISWQLAVAALAAGLILAFAFVLSRRAVKRADHEYALATETLNDHAFDFAWAQPTLRTTGVAAIALDELLKTSRTRGLKLVACQIPGETLFSITTQIILIGFGAVTGWLYLSDRLDGVTAAAMIIVLLRIVETVGSLSLLATPLASAHRRLAFVRELAEQQRSRAPLAPAPRDIAHTTPAISTTALSYSYPDGTVALNDVNFTIPAGGITAIVGSSGSGKSTLLDILAGLREPTTGSIAWDGTPTVAAQRLRNTSIMFQTTELRPGTLRENVTPDGGVDEQALGVLAQHTQLTEVLAHLGDGWDSRVGEGGSTLSGGERQRVGLARALAKPAGVVLVDEATSALDAITERLVVDALGQLRGQRTIVAVTHRPAVITIADNVVVLDAGRVLESGSVDELLNRNGAFAQLWQRWKAIEQWQVSS
ncbi:MAG: ABC transporter ATP-binding protein [Corynebacterium sp.]|uniref:ATP-binding cassette domain-containing protein n=1 Tax=Corynebacterium sp. TaxID=1720 RepID=UPI0026DBE30A|nr:ABC transporter ATP-binding protein [Corynebacterium sp.]MDO4760473.1 ABC transporter ATP-binding protein [Corynebacterium sp.]